MRKFRSVNPFPRFGHAANSTAGKEGEIYVFGGLVKEKRKNDLYVIDSGAFLSLLRQWAAFLTWFREYDCIFH